MLERTYPFFSLFSLLLIGACGVDQSTSPAASTSGTGVFQGGLADAAGGGVCAFDQIICDGTDAKVCDGQGGYSKVTRCDAECKVGIGCVACMPNTGACQPSAAGGNGVNLATICDPTGSQELSFECEGPGMTCDPDGCHGECSPAVLGMSYQGCEFWPTVTANNVWSDRAHVGDTGGFHFGVLLGNVSATVATVSITGPGPDQTLSLGPGEVRGVPLDWVVDLKGPDWDTPFIPSSPTESVKKANGAYRVRSNVPIIAYQANSLEGKIDNANGCPLLSGGGGGCYSYSNDGSMLIPAHALSSTYVVSGYHAWHQDKFPQAASGKLDLGDFISITAVSDTNVTLTLRPNQSFLPSPDLPRPTAGQPATFAMTQGQVIQLFTPGDSDMDTFSGTEISAEKPVQVLSGVSCASIPENGSPCGHVEDAVLPLEILGKDYVVPAVYPVSSPTVPFGQTIRVQSLTDGTALKFEPTSFTGVTLNRGEVLEIPAVTVDVRITANTPFAVTQYLNGRGEFSKAITDGQNVGGPSQVPVVPNGQFRTDYQFIASPYYDSSFVSIVAPTGTTVTVDDVAVPPERFTAVGASGMSVSRQQVQKNNRLHTVHAEKPVGILVYGFSPFSSYMYAGGLDLRRSSVIVK